MAKNWTKIYAKYKGFWIALAEDEETVVGYGKSAREALEKARKEGYDEPILTRVPEKLTAYVGCGV